MSGDEKWIAKTAAPTPLKKEESEGVMVDFSTKSVKVDRIVFSCGR